MENTYISKHNQEQLPSTGKFLVKTWALILKIGVPTVKRKCAEYDIPVLPGWVIDAEWWWAAMSDAAIRGEELEDEDEDEEARCPDEQTAKVPSSRKKPGDTESPSPSGKKAKGSK